MGCGSYREAESGWTEYLVDSKRATKETYPRLTHTRVESPCQLTLADVDVVDPDPRLPIVDASLRRHGRLSSAKSWVALRPRHPDTTIHHSKGPSAKGRRQDEDWEAGTSRCGSGATCRHSYVSCMNVIY